MGKFVTTLSSSVRGDLDMRHAPMASSFPMIKVPSSRCAESDKLFRLSSFR